MIRLTDEQWERIRKHFPEEHIPDGRAGRKPIPTRHVLEAMLWILNTGAQWHMLPQSYPNYKTVHRRFQTWCCNEILRLVALHPIWIRSKLLPKLFGPLRFLLGSFQERRIFRPDTRRQEHGPPVRLPGAMDCRR